MKIKPLADKILVEIIETEEKTQSGIVLPDSAKEEPQRGKVIAVGKGKTVEGKLQPLEVKVGDEVIFAKYSGEEIKIGGKEYKLLKEDDILGTIVE